MATPFASYRGGLQVLPPGWLETYLKVGENYQEGAKQLGSAMVTAAGSLADNINAKTVGRDAAKSNMFQVEQYSQATGQPIDPALTERYARIGDMSAKELGQFNQDAQSYMQSSAALENMRRQKMAFDMQQQAAQRAQQMQGLQQAGSYIDQMIGQRTRPQMGMGSSNMSAASMPSQNGASAPQALMNQFDRFGSLMPTVGTFQGLPMSR